MLPPLVLNIKSLLVDEYNLALSPDVSLKKIGLKLKRVKVGDKNILQEIRTNGHYFGGEPSGHFIFKDDTLIGDGMSTALRVLTIMLKEDIKISELKKLPIPKAAAPIITSQISPFIKKK